MSVLFILGVPASFPGISRAFLVPAFVSRADLVFGSSADDAWDGEAKPPVFCVRFSRRHRAGHLLAMASEDGNVTLINTLKTRRNITCECACAE